MEVMAGCSGGSVLPLGSEKKPPQKTNNHICNNSVLLIPPWVGKRVTPKEGHKFLLSGVRGISKRRD